MESTAAVVSCNQEVKERTLVKPMARAADVVPLATRIRSTQNHY